MAARNVVDDDLAAIVVLLGATLAAATLLADLLVVPPHLVPAERTVGGSADEDSTAEMGQVGRA